MAKRSKNVDQASRGRIVEYRFYYDGNPAAKAVFVAGDFNGWDPLADRMVKRNGTFCKRIRLEPGEYQFKFVVDGEWMADPAADAQVVNSFGSQNSVLHL